MIQGVCERLESLGYTVTDHDKWLLDYLSDTVENQLIRECGLFDASKDSLIIPDALHQLAVDRVCGEFLKSKKATGSIPGFDLTAAVKQIQEGDTSTTFAIGNGDKTPEQRFDELVEWLINGKNGLLASYRCFTW